jgi:hypothetical protein
MTPPPVNQSTGLNTMEEAKRYMKNKAQNAVVVVENLGNLAAVAINTVDYYVYTNNNKGLTQGQKDEKRYDGRQGWLYEGVRLAGDIVNTVSGMLFPSKKDAAVGQTAIPRTVQSSGAQGAAAPENRVAAPVEVAADPAQGTSAPAQVSIPTERGVVQ